MSLDVPNRSILQTWQQKLKPKARSLFGRKSPNASDSESTSSMPFRATASHTSSLSMNREAQKPAIQQSATLETANQEPASPERLDGAPISPAMVKSHIDGSTTESQVGLQTNATTPPSTSVSNSNDHILSTSPIMSPAVPEPEPSQDIAMPLLTPISRNASATVQSANRIGGWKFWSEALEKLSKEDPEAVSEDQTPNFSPVNARCFLGHSCN